MSNSGIPKLSGPTPVLRPSEAGSTFASRPFWNWLKRLYPKPQSVNDIRRKDVHFAEGKVGDVVG